MQHSFKYHFSFLNTAVCRIHGNEVMYLLLWLCKINNCSTMVKSTLFHCCTIQTTEQLLSPQFVRLLNPPSPLCHKELLYYSESDLVTGIKNNKNNYTEIANPLTDDLVCLCGSYRDISITLGLFHNQLKVICSTSEYLVMDYTDTQLNKMYSSTWSVTA